jgi:hypothetical protein
MPNITIKIQGETYEFKDLDDARKWASEMFKKIRRWQRAVDLLDEVQSLLMDLGVDNIDVRPMWEIYNDCEGRVNPWQEALEEIGFSESDLIRSGVLQPA